MTDPHPTSPTSAEPPVDPPLHDPVGVVRESEPAVSGPMVDESPVNERVIDEPVVREPFPNTPHVHAPAPPPQRRRTALPVLCALGFLLLLGGLAWLWSEQQGIRQQLADQVQRSGASARAVPGVDPTRVAALETRLNGLEQRVAMPVAAATSSEGSTADTRKLEARIAALETEKPATAEGPSADTGKLEARIAALETQKPAMPEGPNPDIGKLEARIATLEAQKPPPPPDTAGVIAPLAAKLDSMAAATAAAKSAEAAATARLAELDSRLKQAEQRQTALADRAGQTTQVARAQAALDAGQPLGDMPNAPPALTRFAQAKPPTEAALRLAFPAAADAAEEASRPSAEGESLGARMWLRARSLVTVKRGDAVLVGAPAATVLSNAHARLEAGDLAGAVAALDGLDGAAAQAMADWRAQAQSLLDARAALAKMARA